MVKNKHCEHISKYQIGASLGPARFIYGKKKL